MRLRDLFSDDATIDPRAEAAEVSGLAVDSRAVKPGDVFFALAGAKTDGARFIDQAIAAGAVAVAGDHPPQGGLRVPFVATPNPRRALALAAAKFFPQQPATIAAVTGTSGKTSVAAFTRQIWQRLGHESASIGTIGLVSPKRTIYGSLTTPDPIALHRQLDEIAREGVTHLALEASSHGLDQYRLDGVRIAAGGFTNLSRDHMDYHPDVAHYLAAKLRLFRDLVAADGAAVISADHDCSQTVIDAARAKKLRIVAVGRNGDGAGEGIRLVGADVDGFAQKLDARTSRAQICGAAAAGRRIPDRERAGLRGPCDRHRQRTESRVRRTRTARGRQRPAGAGRRAQWRADLRRLRPQARCAGEGAAGAAALRQTQARRGVRRRRRSRCRQACLDGRDRHRRMPTASSSPTTIRAAKTRQRSAPRSWARRRAPGRSATAPRRSARRSRRCSRAMRC